MRKDSNMGNFKITLKIWVDFCLQVWVGMNKINGGGKKQIGVYISLWDQEAYKVCVFSQNVSTNKDVSGK